MYQMRPISVQGGFKAGIFDWNNCHLYDAFDGRVFPTSGNVIEVWRRFHLDEVIPIGGDDDHSNA